MHTVETVARSSIERHHSVGRLILPEIILEETRWLLLDRLAAGETRASIADAIGITPARLRALIEGAEPRSSAEWDGLMEFREDRPIPIINPEAVGMRLVTRWSNVRERGAMRREVSDLVLRIYARQRYRLMEDVTRALTR